MLTINSTNSLFKQNGIVNGQRGYIEDLQFEIKKDQEKLKVIWVIFSWQGYWEVTTGKHEKEGDKKYKWISCTDYRSKENFSNTRNQHKGNKNPVSSSFVFLYDLI